MNGLAMQRLTWAVRPSAAAVRLLGLAAVAALTVVFALVVQGAVQQGEARRTSADAQALAQWRCSAEHPAAVRRDCVARLLAAPAPDVPSPIPLVPIRRERVLAATPMPASTDHFRSPE